MKAVIALTIALSFGFAHAQEDMNLADCAAVTPIALLAKDNMPYWSESENSTQKISCYNALKAVAQNASAEQIAEIEAAFEGEVQICGNDRAYADFIQANKVNTQEEDFVVEASNETWTPVYKPKAVFFQSNPSF